MQASHACFLAARLAATVHIKTTTIYVTLRSEGVVTVRKLSYDAHRLWHIAHVAAELG